MLEHVGVDFTLNMYDFAPSEKLHSFTAQEACACVGVSEFLQEAIRQINFGSACALVCACVSAGE